MDKEPRKSGRKRPEPQQPELIVTQERPADYHRTIGEVITEWSKGLGLILDYLKVTRRTVLAVYGWFLYETSQWFFALPDPSTQQVTYVTAILGLAGIIFGFYSNSPSDYIKLDKAKTRQYGNRRSSSNQYDSRYGSEDSGYDASTTDDGFWDDSER